MAGFIMITVIVFIAALGISYFSRSGSRNRTTRSRSSGSSADSYFYPGVDPSIADGGSRHKSHSGSDGHSGPSNHHGHGHHHGGSSWDSGSHHSSHGGSDFGGGGDSGGGDSGGGDSGGGGGD